MAIQGSQNLSGITLNNGQSVVFNRTADYDGLENLSNPEEWQQGDGFSTSVTNISTVTNNITQYFSGGSYLLTGLIEDSVSDASYNAGVLESGITGFQSNVLVLPVGIYYIGRELNSGLLQNVRSCFITSFTPDTSWQLHEQAALPDKRGTTLVFLHDNTGNVAFRFPCTGAGNSSTNIYGPYAFSNFRIECATGSAFEIGSSTNTQGGGTGSIQTRGTKFSDMSISLTNQQFTNSTGNLLYETGNNVRIQRDRAESFGIRLWGAYDLDIRNTAIRGGYYGVDLYDADFPALDNVHFGHQYICLKHTTRSNAVSVHGTYNRCFFENYGMAAAVVDRGNFINCRAEWGYVSAHGAFNMPAGVTWSIAGTGSGMTLAGLTGARVARDYFEELIPFSVVDSSTNRKYWFQPVSFSGSQITIGRATSTSFVNRTMSGSIMTRYYGTPFSINGDVDMIKVDATANKDLPNLPVGFIVPQFGRSTVVGFNPNGIGYWDTGNQFRVVGHSRGVQFGAHAGVDWIGGDVSLAPVESPLADIYGAQQYDDNATPYISAQSSEASIPGRKWVARKGIGVPAFNGYSYKIEMLNYDGRMVEDVSKLNFSSYYSRAVKLVGLQPGTGLTFKYSLRGRITSGASALISVNAYDNINGGLKEAGSGLTIYPYWTYATGQINVTTGFQGGGDYKMLMFDHTGNLMIDEIIIRKIDFGEV